MVVGLNWVARAPFTVGMVALVVSCGAAGSSVLPLTAPSAVTTTAPIAVTIIAATTTSEAPSPTSTSAVTVAPAAATTSETTSALPPSPQTSAIATTLETNDPTNQTDASELDAATVLATIPVAKETQAGYDRNLFDEWQTDPATGCTIRDTVLLVESITPATLTTGCVIASGRWLSAYDNVTVTNPSSLDVDHLIPLKEAWDSGAVAWDPATRAAFANDITDPRTLIAVTASANRSKGDRDPSNWIPPDNSYVCTYISDWIAVKARWQLTMDQSEAGRLRNLIRDRCPGLTIAQWSSAIVTMATPEPETVPESLGTTTPGRQPGGAVYYKNCAAAKAAGVTPLHRGDPGYRTGLDGDGDGTACES